MTAEQNHVRLVGGAREHALELVTLVRLTHSDSVAYVATAAEAQSGKYRTWTRAHDVLTATYTPRVIASPAHSVKTCDISDLEFEIAQ
jgi:hypothetical protein